MARMCVTMLTWRCLLELMYIFNQHWPATAAAPKRQHLFANVTIFHVANPDP
jgi:hypothetical protein